MTQIEPRRLILLDSPLVTVQNILMWARQARVAPLMMIPDKAKPFVSKFGYSCGAADRKL